MCDSERAAAEAINTGQIQREIELEMCDSW
jgi:hypothetical protein